TAFEIGLSDLFGTCARTLARGIAIRLRCRSRGCFFQAESFAWRIVGHRIPCLEWSDDDQAKNEEQQDHRQFVIPAVVCVTTLVAALTAAVQYTLAVQMVARQTKHQGQFGMHPPLGATQAVA